MSPDNGPCFISQERQKLMEEYSIEHTASSPHHHQSNGLVERGIGNVKTAVEEGKGQVEGVASVSHHTIGETGEARRVDDG